MEHFKADGCFILGFETENKASSNARKNVVWSNASFYLDKNLLVKNDHLVKQNSQIKSNFQLENDVDLRIKLYVMVEKLVSNHHYNFFESHLG